MGMRTKAVDDVTDRRGDRSRGAGERGFDDAITVWVYITTLHRCGSE